MTAAKAARILLLLALAAVLAVLWQNIYREKIVKPEYPLKYSGLVAKYSSEQGLDPMLVYAVIKTESGFDPAARSRIGARGLMQLTPDTFDWAMMLSQSKDKLTADDLDTPQVNIKYGTVVLAALRKEFGSDRTALAAYHAGRTTVKKWLADKRYSQDGRSLKYIPYDETRRYVGRVLTYERTYRMLYGK
jgi:soluble lytic murein transglycosylase